MTLQRSRMTAWVTWFLAPVATLIWMPRLLGTEPAVFKPAKRPTFANFDVTPLPEKAAKPATPESVKAPTLRFSGGTTLRPSIIAESDAPESAPLFVNPVPEPKLDVPARSLAQPLQEVETIQRPIPASPQLAPKLETVPWNVAPRSPMPHITAASLQVAGLSVRYWVVSTRCCQQYQRQCGPSCRFVCHAMTDNSHVHSVCVEELLGSLAPGSPTCIFVHGGFRRGEETWHDAEASYQWLRSACPPTPFNFIYFTWPSEGTLTYLSNNIFASAVPGVDMAILGRRSELTGFYLADLVGAIPPGCPVSLIGHSLGARTVVSGLHLLAGGRVQGQPRWNRADAGNRIRAVLAAAAIEHDWLNPGDRYGCALNRAECLLNLRNERDFALAFFPLRRPFSSRALARAGFTRDDQRRLGAHVCQVSELDVSQLIGPGHGWPNYVGRPEIAAAVSPFVFFSERTREMNEPAELPR